jgi:hypothetical protein
MMQRQLEFPTMTTINLSALNGMSHEQLVALVAQMAAQPARKLTMKVSDKGALSVYGLGRFPVTLYRSQWERLFSAKDEVETFITVNAALLTTKA